MRVYTFAEHFPNPYKPYYDTQFAQLLEDGHDLRVFTFGKYVATRNAKLDAYALDRRTTYLPFTLRTVPAMLPALVREAAIRPSALWRGLAATRDPEQSAKRNLLDAARALLLPEEPPDLVLIHNLITAQFLGFLVRLYPTARVALYFHGGELPDGHPIPAVEARRVFRYTHRVLTNSVFSRRQIIERGCPPEKVAIVPVGFRLDDYRPAPRKQYRASGLLRVITVGRVSVEKGLQFALDAAQHLRARGIDRFRLRIIGAGTALAELRRNAHAAHLAPLVEFAGEKPHHALADEYRDADVLLLPSIPTDTWEENQACVLQEAMLMKLVVIASRTGGVQESIAPEQRRFSVVPRDSAGIARRIEQILALDEGEMQRLGEAGRAFAREHYDIRQINRKLLDESLGIASPRPDDAVPA